MRFGGVQNSTRYRRAKPLSVIKGLSTSGPSSETFTSLCIARLRARLAGLCMPARLVSQIRTTLNCSIDLASSNAALVKIRLLVTFEPPKMTAFIGSPNGSFFTITDQWPNARTVIGFFSGNSHTWLVAHKPVDHRFILIIARVFVRHFVLPDIVIGSRVERRHLLDFPWVLTSSPMPAQPLHSAWGSQTQPIGGTKPKLPADQDPSLLNPNYHEKQSLSGSFHRSPLIR